jgi:Uri superfamily endonuclease
MPRCSHSRERVYLDGERSKMRFHVDYMPLSASIIYVNMITHTHMVSGLRCTHAVPIIARGLLKVLTCPALL